MSTTPSQPPSNDRPTTPDPAATGEATTSASAADATAVIPTPAPTQSGTDTPGPAGPTPPPPVAREPLRRRMVGGLRVRETFSRLALIGAAMAILLIGGLAGFAIDNVGSGGHGDDRTGRAGMHQGDGRGLGGPGDAGRPGRQNR